MIAPPPGVTLNNFPNSSLSGRVGNCRAILLTQLTFPRGIGKVGINE